MFDFRERNKELFFFCLNHNKQNNFIHNIMVLSLVSKILVYIPKFEEKKLRIRFFDTSTRIRIPGEVALLIIQKMSLSCW